LSHRDEADRAITRAGGRNPQVFGSVALGTDTPPSDIDILADLGGVDSIWSVAALVEELERLRGVGADLVDHHGGGTVLHRARSQALPL
jgi:predicted nucleotidyltransferase